MEQELLRPESRGVVALSGGPDSTVLLDLLARLSRSWDLELTIAHFDHQLRPGGQDAHFVREVGERYGIPVRLGTGDVRGTAARGGMSIQQAARVLRYRFLEEVAGEARGEWIAVAQHADDQVETILLNQIRGTGFRGLAGMPVRRDRIIRPLLSLDRASLVDYAYERGLAFRLDPSNLDLRYRRNWIRHRLLPHLRQLDPDLEGRLLRLAGLLRRFTAAMDRTLEYLETRCFDHQSREAMVIGVASWRSYPEWLQEEVLRHAVNLLTGRRPGAAHTAILVRLARYGGSGKVLSCVPGVRAIREYEEFRLERADATAAPPNPASFPVPTSTVHRLLPWGRGWLDVELSVLSGVQARGRLGEDGVEFFDLDRLTGGLTLRTWKPGDRLAPWGMVGTKKVQDVFTDQKIPRSQREVWPLLSNHDQLLWVVGLRRGRDAPLTATSTRALGVSVHPVGLEFLSW